MKIALIHSHLNDRGGSQRYVIEIANNLKELGVEVDVFCYEYNEKSCYLELTEKLNIQKIYTREINSNKRKPGRKSNLFKGLLKKVYKIKVVEKLVSVLGVDYLYSLYSTNKLAKEISDLMLDSNNEYDLIFAHEEPLSVYAAIKYKKVKNIPIYWFCYDTIEKWFLEWEEKHKNSVLRKFLLQNIYFKYDKKIINKYIDKSAVLDNKMLERYKRIYGNTPLIRRGGVPQNILEYPRENILRDKFDLSDDTIIIFSLTRFLSYRRVHDIFDMFEKLDKNIQEKVFVYLNSPITDERYYEWCMKNYKKTLENKNIKINLNYPQNDTEMYGFYLSSDIFIFPNENQTWGHAPLEAMACRVATLVSTGCGISEVMRNITSEGVFKVGDIDELSQKVEDIIKNKTHIHISKNQKKYVAENLTWRKVCEVYIKDFKEILGDNNV